MTTAITVGYRHKTEEPVVLALPSAGVSEQKDRIKSLRLQKTHADFSRIEMWESGAGRCLTVRFDLEPPKTPQKK